MTDQDQDLVAAVLASAPPSEVSAGFASRVHARIDAAQDAAGWTGLADFRVWTLRLAPAAAVLALIAALWPGSAASSSASSAPSPVSAAQAFAPASASDWQQDVTANALLEAAMRGAARAR